MIDKNPIELMGFFIMYVENIAVRYFRNQDKSTLQSGRASVAGMHAQESLLSSGAFCCQNAKS